MRIRPKRLNRSNLRILLAVVSAIVLFLYGLAFSQEIQRVGGEVLRKWLACLTESRWPQHPVCG